MEDFEIVVSERLKQPQAKHLAARVGRNVIDCALPLAMAGYSGTPLVKKLGFKNGFRAAIVNPPKGFEKELMPLPEEVTIFNKSLPKSLDLILFFTDSEQTLFKEFPRLARKLEQNGMLWIAWPKKASGVNTDVTEAIVRRIGLDAGLVDVKICAVNEVWSGLKFVYRLKDRVSF